MFDKLGQTSHESEETPPYSSHEDFEKMKASGESRKKTSFQDGKPVAHSPGTNMATHGALGCLLESVPGFLRSRLVVGLLQPLVPSFLRSGASEPRKLHPTAWLDGMRGISALCVVVFHSTLVWFSWKIHEPYVPGSFEIIKMPIIRIFITSTPHVALFFIVSGYAISYKPLKLIHQGRFAEASSTLASSFFRRHPRLYMPAVIITFFSALMTHMGWYNVPGLPGLAIPTRRPPYHAGFWDQMKSFALAMVWNTDPIGQEHPRGGVPRKVENAYDPNLWTVPIEFNTSLVVFMFLVAFSRVRNRVRMLFAFALIIYFEYFWHYWALILFLEGMLICDLHFEIDDYRSRSAKNMLPSEALPVWARVPQGVVSRIWRKIAGSRILGRITSISLFIVALCFLSVPGVKTIDTVSTHVGAVILVLVVDHSTYLQIIFNHPFSQYLGRVSYSLYLVHGPLLWTFGSYLGRRFVALTGGQTNEAYILAIAMAALLWWPVAIWLADLTYRVVDVKCVQVARWSYEKLLKKEA